MEEQTNAPKAGNSSFTNRKRRREEDEVAAESSKTGKRRYCCSKCNLVTDRLADFNKHLKSHGSNKAFVCPDCDFSSSRKYGVAIHLKLSHNTGQSSSSGVLFLFGLHDHCHYAFKWIYFTSLGIIGTGGGCKQDMPSSWKKLLRIFIYFFIVILNSIK